MTSIERIAARYLHVLADRLGWEAAVDGDLVVVRLHGRVYLVDLLPGDPEYLRMSLGGQHGSALPPSALAAVAMEATRATKGAKVVVDGGYVIAACEMVVAPPDCLPDPDLLAAVLPRAVSMIDSGVRRFLDGRELAGIAAATDDARVDAPGRDVA